MNIDKYYKQLEGAKILKFCGVLGQDEYTFEGFPTFMIELENGQRMKIEISRDTEGNDGGFLFMDTVNIIEVKGE